MPAMPTGSALAEGEGLSAGSGKGAALDSATGVALDDAVETGAASRSHPASVSPNAAISADRARFLIP